MGEWGFLSGLFDSLQAHSPMLGRFWLLLMLVFRILILGTVASDMFEDEQAEFACNTLQPGCKQVCYDMAFPISQYRFWVFHIVLIATPSLVFLMYTVHHRHKQTACSKGGPDPGDDLRLRRFYIVNVAFRMAAEVGFLAGQWLLYGFRVEAQFPCSRFPCPYTVDCFTSRPAEKTVFLCFYFVVGVVAALSSCAELLHSSKKWFCSRSHCASENGLHKARKEEEAMREGVSKEASSSVRLKGRSLRGNRKGHKHRGGKYVSSRGFVV